MFSNTENSSQSIIMFALTTLVNTIFIYFYFLVLYFHLRTITENREGFLNPPQSSKGDVSKKLIVVKDLFTTKLI